MAKPIPNLDLRNLSKLEEIKKEICSEPIPEPKTNNHTRNLLLGTASGWIVGVGVARVGKVAAFGLGGGVLLLHFATELGYVHVNWVRVKEAVGRSQDLIDKVVTFVRNNSGVSVGFLGGFFFGVASAGGGWWGLVAAGGHTATVSAFLTQFVRARPTKPSQPAPIEEERPVAITDDNTSTVAPAAKPPEPTKPEEPPPFHEKQSTPTFIAPKMISQSPKISPSSIPNPSPSVTTTKQVEPGYPNYGGYMYSVPGYSAFQPVSYPGIIQPTPTAAPQSTTTETNNSEFIPFPIVASKDKPPVEKEDEKIDGKTIDDSAAQELPRTQEDLAKIVPEIKPAISNESNKTPTTELKISVTSLAQGSGAIVTIPPPQVPNKDIKKKPPERFSLKTSIPISKLDMKCVGNSQDSIFHNNTQKKPFNPAFHTPSIKESGPKIEIQSNIVIKSATKESDVKEIVNIPPPNNSISTLIDAAEAINKTESQFKTPDPKPELFSELKEPSFASPTMSTAPRPLFNPINLDSSKSNFLTKPPDTSLNEQKNQIVFIQNKNQSNPKMLVAIQQQNPQVLLQRTNFDQKNLQAPSRPSSQSKKSKEELVNENSASSKVVSLKRMHQDNYDENDFENLITENQIYGNKIVVKEKSQGTSQEQDLKNKTKTDKFGQLETKNVVLQPNFVYLSNVQFSPANLMMIKNNTKVTDCNKIRISANEYKHSDSVTNNDTIKSYKPQNIPVSKEIHVLKSSNNVLQTLPNNNYKPDIVFQTPSQKVIMNPQILYQVPMIVDADSKLNQTFVKDYPTILGQNKRDIQKPFDQTKSNDKLYIACPYQMDSKLQPKIVITNIRPKITKVEELSTLDMYEQRKRLRRLKYLSNRDPKISNDIHKPESKKQQDNFKNIITSENMSEEIYKEFATTKMSIQENSNESDSDYGEDELEKYHCIIQEFGESANDEESKENESRKVEFLAQFRLATQDECRDRELDRQERIIRRDAVASAYIAVGRIDCLQKEGNALENNKLSFTFSESVNIEVLRKDEGVDQLEKSDFLTNLNLIKVSQRYKEDYEKVWQEVVKDRKRREHPKNSRQINHARYKIVELDPRGQLEMLTEIKKQVNENNNLIKKRFDTFCDDGESIKILAEKNFSELNRLSKMADRSVKHFSGQETRKRDLNPGFDSENIQKRLKSNKYYPDINIPNISKIISLKTEESVGTVASTQATSMDEPQSSAAGVSETFGDDFNKSQEVGCQVEEYFSWQGVEAIIKNYKEYDIARKKEVADLHKRNTSLRVESAHITRAASQESDRARALVAERRNLANEERAVRNSIQWLHGVVDVIRNYEEKWS